MSPSTVLRTGPSEPVVSEVKPHDMGFAGQAQRGLEILKGSAILKMLVMLGR